MFQPLGDRILLKKIVVEEKSPSGLILPNEKKEERYEVVSLGEGRRNNDGSHSQFSFVVGDIVTIEKFQIGEIKLDNQLFYITRADNIIGIYK